MRNSHLISIAPTGTISFTADNVSSGIEPVFSLEVDRTYNTEDGPNVAQLKDYVWANYGLRGEVIEDLTSEAHINMLLACAPFVDSSISKTINVGNSVTFDEFKNIYVKCWKGKAKGCTTFRPAGKRYGILVAKPDEGAACFINEDTGQKECE